LKEVGLITNPILEDNLAAACFICNINEETVRGCGQKYDAHCNVDHDPWNYVYYLFYLKKKGEKDLDGNEYSVWVDYNDRNVDFMPEMISKFLGVVSNIYSHRLKDLTLTLKRRSAS